MSIPCPRSIRTLVTLLGMTAIAAAAVAPVDDITGHWKGRIDVAPGNVLEIEVDFSRSEEGAWKGAMDIAAQNAMGLELTQIVFEGGRLSFRMPSVPGNASFDGKLDSDSAHIQGTFNQFGRDMPLSIVHSSRLGADAAALLEGFAQWVDSARQDLEVPGVAVCVVKGDATVFAQGFGLRDVEQGKPVTADTLFAIGSTTKAFTTFLLATLVERGELSWDEPVRTYLPEWRLKDAFATEQITLRDMVTHRSGLPRHDLVWYGNPGLEPADLLKSLRYLEPSASLRARWQYNNLMVAAAGFVAGRAYGSDWETGVRETIFEPLGMERSCFSVDAVQQDEDFALPYAQQDGKLERIPFRRLAQVGPAGAIFSSVREMGEWLKLHLGEGTYDGHELLPAQAVRDLHTPHMTVPGFWDSPDLRPVGYGLGWSVQIYRGHAGVEHGGGIDGFTALVALLPDEDVGLVVLSNSGSGFPGVVVRHALDRLLGLEPRDWAAEALKKSKALEAAKAESESADNVTRVEGTHPSHDLDDYTGRFDHPAYGTLTIERAGDRLVVQLNGLTGVLEHWHYEVFRVSDTEDDVLGGTMFRFETNLQGRVSAVIVPAEPSVDPARFPRHVGGDLVDPAFLASLAGRYEFMGGLQEVTMALRGKTLTATIPGQPTYRLVPSGERTFDLKELKGYQVTFVLDEVGSVSHVLFIQPNGTFKATPIPSQS